MGKSSSSSKKIKHSRDSSKLRSVKKKKKTKRIKSKKIRRLKDYSDASDSSGSDSSSLYSSSEDDYRRKKKRRSKLSKKRSRKRYSSSESDDDDDDDDDDDGIRLLKEKKRSKRKDKHVGKKKKIGSRKRRKRDLSSSSASSESCSIRSSQSDDGSESCDGKRSTRDRERFGKFTAAKRRSKDESEEDCELNECWQMEDEVMTEKNPRRLKSIIVVSYTYDRDHRKEDMVNDNEDVYLTREGNSSSNRELGHNGESDERDGDPRTHAIDNGRKTVGYDEFGEKNKSEISKSSYIDNNMKDDDLEAILKKRALENLKKYRGVTQKSGIARKEVSSVSEGEPLQIESEKVVESQHHSLLEQKLCAGGKDLETSQKILQVPNIKESGISLANLASQQNQQSGNTGNVKTSSGISSGTTKPKLIRPVLGQENLNLASMEKAAGCQDAEAESISGSTIDKNLPESSLARATKNGGENIEPTNSTLKAQPSSHADTETLDKIKGGTQSEQKTMDETKDESQYEQKTMTVMRGGELVEVSYKVYIPKKTSSLGRRQFKR